MSIPERKCIPLLPGVSTFNVTFGRDGKSFLYAVASRGKVTIYSQPWRDGKLIGAAAVALKVPFVFPLTYHDANAYDFSKDLSTCASRRSRRPLSSEPELNLNRATAPSSRFPVTSRSGLGNNLRICYQQGRYQAGTHDGVTDFMEILETQQADA